MKSSLLLFLSLLSLNVFAQSGNVIKGSVKTSDQEPAVYVNVLVKGTNRGATTDSYGKYSIKNVPTGSITLVISFIGLESREVDVRVTNGTTNVEDIVLNESSEKLDEITITGSRTYKEDNVSSSLRLNSPLIEVPQNIQTVTGKMLYDQQTISMSDNLIRNVSGAVRLEHWGDLYANIMMRGSQIQAFRNGFNVVNSFWGPLTEDMSFVDHIEFVKGPAGFMLANGDPAGLYNVVTKKPTGVTKGEASFTLGSYDLYRATLDLDGKLSKDGRLLYRLNLAGQNKGSHRPNEFNDRYSIAPVISYQINNDTKITFEYTLQLARMSDVGSYYVFSPDGYGTLPVDFTTMPKGLPATKINDHSVFLNLQHNINENWQLTTQLSYFNYQQTGTSMWPASVNADGTMIRGVGIWDAASGMTMGQIFVNGKERTGSITHKILAGLDVGTKDYQADWSQSHNLDSAGAEFDPKAPNLGAPVNGYPVYDRSLGLEARAVLGGGLMDQRYSGIYLQDELGFWDNKFRVTLAARYTHVKQATWGGDPIEADHVTPRLGLSVSVNKYTSIYALYDQAFLPQGGRLANGNDVKPITGNNIEFGIKKDWAEGRWNTTFSVYRILKKNELTADPNSSPTSGLSVVLGEKTAQGFEFDMKGNIIDGLNLTANYAYTDSKVTKVTEGVTSMEKGDVIPGFAKHTVNAWLSYKIEQGPLTGLGVSAGATFLGDRATASWSNTNNDVNLPNYFRFDAGLFYEKDKMRVALNVFNVLDKYLYSGGYYDWLSSYYWQTEAPRNFRMSVGYRF